jgi:hypothetical protein
LLFDPYYVRQDLFDNTAFDEELEIDCVGSTRNILRKFYPLRTQAAMYEVLNLVTMEGRYGAEATILQEYINQCIPDGQTFKSEVEKVIWKQNKMLPTKNLWRSIGKAEYNHLSEIGIRLAVLSVQSANVERVCKAHGVVHSKTRNRLKLKNVQMLLFCYVNLRLLKKDKTSIVEFLESAIQEEMENEEVVEAGNVEDAEEEDSNDIEDAEGGDSKDIEIL